MSDIVAEFNPLTAPQTIFTVPQTAANGAIVFWNESNISMNISLQNGSRFYLPAWYNKHLCGYSGSVNIAWAVRTVLTSGPPPTSEVIVEAYAAGEHFPADGALVRQANGNTNTVTTQNTLVNDGAAAGMSIVESKVGTDPSSVQLSNDAQFTLGSTLHQAVMQVIGTLISSGVITASAGIDAGLIGHPTAINVQVASGQSVQFGLAGIDTIINGGGGQLIGSTLQLKNGTFNSQLTVDSAGNLNADHPIGTRIFQMNSGGIDLRSTGKLLAASSIQLTTGTMARVSRFTGTLGTAAGGSSIAHGLGIAPDFVVLTVNSSSATTTYSCTSDATNVQAFGNATLGIIGYAFHA